MMTPNPLLDELHETRRKQLADAGGTLEGLIAGLRERQRESGRRILKTRRTVVAAEATELGEKPRMDQPVPIDRR